MNEYVLQLSSKINSNVTEVDLFLIPDKRTNHTSNIRKIIRLKEIKSQHCFIIPTLISHIVFPRYLITEYKRKARDRYLEKSICIKNKETRFLIQSQNLNLCIFKKSAGKHLSFGLKKQLYNSLISYDHVLICFSFPSERC